MLTRFRRLIAALGLAAAALPGGAVTMYDAALGLPGGQSCTTTSIGTAGTQSVSGGVLTLDGTGGGVDTWGMSRLHGVSMNSTIGYDVSLTMRLAAETHTNANRAGFSFLFTSTDSATRALEVAFWPNEVWVYHYVAGAFVHGTGAAFDTTAALTNYRVRVQGTSFELFANEVSLFSGTMQNYTGQGFPYTLTNYMFFGDNTSSGSSISEVSLITVSAIPEPGGWVLLLAGIGIVLLRARARR